MRITLRRGSALLLAMILLLQSVLTIPVEVRGDAVGEEFMIKAAHVTDIEKNLTKSMKAGGEYLLALDMTMTLQEGEEKRNLTLDLPDFFALENLADLEEALQIAYINGKLTLSLSGDKSFEGTLFIPFRMMGEDQNATVGLQPLEEGYVLSLQPVQMIEEELKSDEETSFLLEEAAPLSTVEEDFRFMNITFTDEAGNVFSADNPYNITGKEIGKLAFTFYLVEGHEVKAGDTLSFPLPKELKPVTATSGLLGDIGTWTVSLNGLVNFVFNENVDGDDVEGSFFFRVVLDEEKMDEAVEQVIEFEGYPEFTLTFPVSPKGGTAIDKKGTINRQGFNSTEAYWSVDINTALLKMVNPIVTDVIPNNMLFKEGSLVVRSLEVNAKGVRTLGEVLDPSLYTLEMVSGNPKIIFHGLVGEKLQKAYRLEYTTTIQEPSEGFSGSQIFKNRAELTSDGKSSSAQSTVTSGYGIALKKESPVYDSIKQQLSWEIKYNYNEKAIPKAQAFLTDTWTPAGVMNLVENSFFVYPVDINDQGDASVSVQPLNKDLYTMTYDTGKGFMLQFLEDNGGQAYVIRYKTQLVNTSGDVIITGSGTVNNKVETGQGKTSTGSGGYGQQGLIKRRVGTDVGKKEIKYEVLINRNGYVMENLVLKDQFTGDGLSLLEDTVVIKDSNDVALEKGTDYLLSYTAPSGTTPGSFRIEFLNTINKQLTLTYTTKFERNSDGTAAYRNTAGISWKYDGKDYSIGGVFVDTVPAGHTAKNGVKNGSYNAVEKKITWSIYTNYARLPIGNPYTISDVLDTSQEYVADSLEVFTYEVNEAGDIINEITMAPEKYQVEFPSTANGNTIRVTLVVLESNRIAVGIKFKTQFRNELINKASIENNASLLSGSASFPLTAEVSIPYGGKIADKSGVQAGNFNERADWTVYLNPSQSKLREYVLVDMPDLNSVLLKNTFQVVKGKVEQNGTITKTATVLEKGKDYTLEFFADPVTGNERFELKFLYEIREAYVLSYSSYIDPLAPKGEAIKNVYTASGKNVQGDLSGGATSQIVKKNDGGGTGQSVRGVLELIKKNEQSQLLSGARFGLYTLDGKQLLREAVTNEEGTLIFGGLRRGKYLLKELAAPEGYVIGDDLAKGIVIELSHTEVQLKTVLNYTNEKTKATICKITSAGALISSVAVFDLYKADGTLYAQNLKTVDGVIHLEDLPEGRYYVMETQAPVGYIKNTAKEYFDIRIEENGTQKETEVVVKNYKGSVELKKIDKNGQALSGAVFSLLDAEGKILREDLRVDSEGRLRVSDLSPGKYKLMETEAPSGYLLNVKGMEFEISESVEGEPKTFSKDNYINYKGAAELYKTDAAKKPLQGAVFKVVDENGITVQENLVSREDGRVHALNLSPGTYSFVETKAPAGYVLDRTPKSFVIPASNSGEPSMVVAGDRINYKGSVYMKKVSENGNLLSGAVFALYEKLQDGRVKVGEYTSTSMGLVTAGNLAPGSYEFIEVKAPEGYIINKDPVAFEISDKAEGEPLQMNAGEAVNYKGSVLLTKLGEEEARLEGAEFSLYQEGVEEALMEGLVTDEEGELILLDLSPGNYYFLETKAPAGYIRNLEPLSFSIQETDTGAPERVSVSMENYKGSVLLQKENSEGEPLLGAVFALYNESGDVVLEDITSDDEGVVRIESLEPGKYLLKETKAPEGYLLNTEPVAFLIAESAEGVPEVLRLGSFINYFGSAELVKTNGNEEPLAGAVFELRDEEGEEVLLEGLTTDEEGTVLIEDLTPGTYRLYEVEAPKGYLRNLEPAVFTILEEANGKPEPVKVGPFVNHKGTAVLKKVDEEGNGLMGAEFALYDEEGLILQEGLVSDEEGKVLIEDLSPGTYVLKEVQSPEGYLLNLTEITFTIEDTYEGTVDVLLLDEYTNYLGSAYLIKTDHEGNALSGATFDVVTEDGERVIEDLRSDENGKVLASGLAPGKYYFEETRAPKGYVRNTEKIFFDIASSEEGSPDEVYADTLVNYKGSAVLKKTAVDGTGLKDAEFALYSEEGLLLENLTTDGDGSLLLEDLSPGSYWLEETKAPEGYIRNTDKIIFEILMEAKGEPLVLTLDEFINWQGSVLLRKSDDTGNPLEGAVFALRKDNETIKELTTDALGQILVEGLTPGGYEFMEISAPAGFILDPTIHEFRIPADAAGEPEQILMGTIKNHQGKIVLEKTDEKGAPLAGAVFELRDQDGNLIRKELVSDQEGKVKAEGLFPGSYLLRETHAPEGYIRNEQTISFTVTEEHLGTPEVLNLGKFVNYRGSLLLKKVDEDGQPLQGAQFELKRLDGETESSFHVSDESGFIKIEDLSPGRYSIEEIKAPEGYTRNEEVFTFTIVESVIGKPDTVEMTVVNTLEFDDTEGQSPGEELPSTGESENGILLPLLGTMLVLAGVFHLIRRKKEKIS
ncbi:SpaA isopeptide-forming pilin-related protein [Proteiniclasticum ruminis]|uniref:SpaA isopeptide-forming pilin-related protein n=1 Tax=Proteiniclasticum ruminis TaxID=398199 RepID=UPI00289E5722|nr:SpaA isopeptide-forming pilin-related protein [Proteiniclasticum ruminis]